MGIESVDLAAAVDIGQLVNRRLREAFKYGIECDIIHGKMLSGGVEQNLEVKSLTQNYEYGSSRSTRDGRVFKYSLSGGACYTGQGNAHYQDKAIAANCAAAVLAGASTITIATQTFDADELKGGYITVYGNPGGAANNASCPHRRVTGNTVCAGTTVTITVDRPFDRAIDNAQFCEVYHNPYRDIRLATSGVQAIGGLAALYIPDAGYNFWLQSWGPVWNAAQLADFAGGGVREAYFRHDGSIEARENTVDTNKQRAGYIIPSGFTAGPLLMLQITPC